MAKKKKKTGSKRSGKSSGRVAASKRPPTTKARPAPKVAAPSPPSVETPKAEGSSVINGLARLHIWQIQAFRDVLFVGAILGVIWGGYVLRAITVPLLIAILLAYLAEPVVRWLVHHPRTRMTRAQAVGSILVVGGLVVFLSLVIVVPPVIRQSADLVASARTGSYRQTLDRLEGTLPEWMKEDNKIYALYEQVFGGDADGEDAQQPDGDDAATTPDDGSLAGGAEPETSDATEQVAAGLSEADVRRIVAEELRDGSPADSEASVWFGLVRGGTGAVVRVVGVLIKIGLLFFMIPFYFFFLSLWYPNIVIFGQSLIPEKEKSRSIELLAKMDEVIMGFVRGRIIISLIMGVMLGIGWEIVGVPYSFVLGIIIGIFCAVPFLGFVGVPVAVGLLLIKEIGLPHDSAWWILGAVLLPTAVFAIVQFIEGWILTPYIAGDATDLDPVTIFVVVLAGGTLLGVYGMLLAIPVAACGKILFSELLMPRIQAWTRGEVSDPIPIRRD